jgi:hypothetical protein
MPPSKYSQHLPSALNIFSFECVDELEDEGGLVDLDSFGGEYKPGMPAGGGRAHFVGAGSAISSARVKASEVYGSHRPTRGALPLNGLSAANVTVRGG